ncbi:MAG: membrane-bound lytic murein transglycosylase MltF [Pseudomonadota bacterium]
MKVQIIYKMLLALTVLLLGACNNAGPTEQSISKLGLLRVAILENPHIDFANNRVGGYEIDLLQAYAEKLGVRLATTYVSSEAALRGLVTSRKVHLGLGMLPVLKNTKRFKYGPSIANSDLILVTHTDAALVKKNLQLAELSIAAQRREIANNPFTDDSKTDFEPVVLEHSDASALLKLVEQDVFDGAIVSAIDFELLKRQHPNLKKNYTLRKSVPFAWLTANPATALRKSMNNFIAEHAQNHYTEKRWAFHYDHLSGFDFVDARKFLQRYAKVLPKYRAEFQAAAAEHDFDWRLLAALSYQESHWDPSAVSPTGVQGLMMLTRNTAKELGVSRLDPSESIEGGTRYLANLQSRLPAKVDEQDQPLMALAAYNVGFGHLRDAQRVAKAENKDDGEWQIVKAHLPLLNKKKYASKVRYGRARGVQAVHYVEGVRRYFSMLRLLEPETLPNETPAAQLPIGENLFALF